MIVNSNTPDGTRVKIVNPDTVNFGRAGTIRIRDVHGYPYDPISEVGTAVVEFPDGRRQRYSYHSLLAVVEQDTESIPEKHDHDATFVDVEVQKKVTLRLSERQAGLLGLVLKHAGDLTTFDVAEEYGIHYGEFDFIEDLCDELRSVVDVEA